MATVQDNLGEGGLVVSTLKILRSVKTYVSETKAKLVIQKRGSGVSRDDISYRKTLLVFEILK